jgi:hypothetical protein
MSFNHSQKSRRVLDPMDRVSEVLFALIMVLTFTGTFSAAEAGRAGVREMLIGALGCNLAWGIIDGVMYLMACLSERGQRIATLRAVRGAKGSAEAHSAITEALPAAFADALQPAELEAIRRKMDQVPAPPAHPRLQKADWVGALAVFLLVFASTFPVVIPFILMRDPMVALRVSNVIAVAMLFLTGLTFGRCVGYRPWLFGLSMVVLGCTLVAITVALGG